MSELKEWTVSDDGESILSNNFKHDVMLVVTGDFGGLDDRITYANEIADKLNTRALPSEPGEVAELVRVLRKGTRVNEDGVLCVVSRQETCLQAADTIQQQECDLLIVNALATDAVEDVKSLTEENAALQSRVSELEGALRNVQAGAGTQYSRGEANLELLSALASLARKALSGTKKITPQPQHSAETGAEGVSAWQPIETAIKYGDEIDIANEHRRFTDCFFCRPSYSNKDESDCWVYQEGSDYQGPVYTKIPDPIGWMPIPLPAAPNTEREGV